MLRMLGAMIRGLWWVLRAMWTMPVPRLALVVLVAVWGWWLWWVAVVSWGDPLVGWWAWLVAVVAALLVASAASAVHHIAPSAYRPLAVARAVAYAIALLPAALAAGTWIGGYTALGHIAGIGVEIAVAAGLGAHVYWGPELRT